MATVKRTVTETKTVTVKVCDRCGKDGGGIEMRRCHVCKKEVCFSCGFGVAFYETGKDTIPYVDAFPTVCKACFGAGGEYLSAIRSAAATCEREINQNVDAWRLLMAEEAKP
jgi:hypothetical protein